MGINQICSICNKCDINNEVSLYNINSNLNKKENSNNNTSYISYKKNYINYNNLNLLNNKNISRNQNIPTNITDFKYSTIDEINFKVSNTKNLKEVSLSTMAKYRKPNLNLIFGNLKSEDILKLIILQSKIRQFLYVKKFKKTIFKSTNISNCYNYNSNGFIIKGIDIDCYENSYYNDSQSESNSERSLTIINKAVLSKENNKYIIKNNKQAKSNYKNYRNSILSVKENANNIIIDLQNINNNESRKFIVNFSIVIYNKSGSLYFGNFIDNSMEGIGRFINFNYDMYLGEINKNKSNGYGVFISSNTTSLINNFNYEGEWKDNVLNGIGIEYSTSNNNNINYSMLNNANEKVSYKGGFKNGVKEGLGIQYNNYNNNDNKSFYIGEFKNNKYNGYGIHCFGDGKIYQGQWENNKFNGYGEFHWPDGKKYIGYYSNDKKSGFGIYLWVEPYYKLYIGFWKNGCQDGVGKVIMYKPNEENNEECLKIKWGLFSNSKKTKKLDDEYDAVRHMNRDELKYISLFEFEIQDIINIKTVL